MNLKKAWVGTKVIMRVNSKLWIRGRIVTIMTSGNYAVVKSEDSDLSYVGKSKDIFRYTARDWEVTKLRGLAPSTIEEAGEDRTYTSAPFPSTGHKIDILEVWDEAEALIAQPRRKQ